MPEPGTPVPRPRRPRAASEPLPEPVPISAPQSGYSALGGEERRQAERRMLELVEELHVATRALGLPPQALRIEERRLNGTPATPEQVSALERVDRRLADLDAAAGGPQPAAVSRIGPPEDPDAFLVSGFIRPGTTVMMTGPPGSSKSWASRQLALAAGAGQAEIFKRYGMERPLRCLVIDEDNGPDEEWRREEALLGHLGLTRESVEGTVWRVSLEGVQLDDARWQSWLRGQILLLGLDLVVLDPISEMHGGKELREDPGFRSMLGFLKRLKVEFPRLATLLVHHTRKADTKATGAPKSLDEVRGQWGQTPDVVALMWPLGEQRIHWELFKRVPHSKLILAASPTGPLTVVEDISTVRDKRMSTDDRILSAIEAGAGEWEEIKHATGLSKAGIFKSLGRLHRAGLVSKGAPYELLVDRTDDPLPGHATTPDEGQDEGGEFVE